MFSFNYLFEGEHVHSGSPIGRFVLLWKQQWRIPGWIVSNESRLKISRSLLIIGFSGDFKIFATILWTIDELPSSSQVSSDLEETPVRGSKVPTSIRALLHTLLPSYGRKKQWYYSELLQPLWRRAAVGGLLERSGFGLLSQSFHVCDIYFLSSLVIQTIIALITDFMWSPLSHFKKSLSVGMNTPSKPKLLNWSFIPYH